MPISLSAEVELLKQYRNFPVSNNRSAPDSSKTFSGQHVMSLVIYSQHTFPTRPSVASPAVIAYKQ
jgi:hypothetical protein